MAAKKKTWVQKWEDAKAKPNLPSTFRCEKSGMNISIPSPEEVEEMVRGIPSGSVKTSGEIAAELTKKHGSDMCCPLTTGIFAWLLAYAAHEMDDGSIPWWRVVKAKGEINPKFPSAPELQKGLLESEGLKVFQKGKKTFVEI